MPPFAVRLSPWQRSLLQWLGCDFADSPSERAGGTALDKLADELGRVRADRASSAAIVYAIFALYRREMDSCPCGPKWSSPRSRVGVVLLLACIFLGPAVVYLQNRTVQPTIVLARDASQSMNTADNYAEPPARQDNRRHCLAKRRARSRLPEPTRACKSSIPCWRRANQRLLDGTGSQRAASGFRFCRPDDEGRAAATVANAQEQEAKRDAIARRPMLPPLVAEGRGTDLANAIRQSLAADRPAAVVHVHAMASTPPRTMRSKRPAKQSSKACRCSSSASAIRRRRRNVGVAKVYSRPQAWQEEPFEIDAMINFQDAEPADVRVELRRAARRR